MYQHILVPTDGTVLSEKAISGGVALARALKSKITGLHVVLETLPTYYGESGWIDPQVEQRLRDSARVRGEKLLRHIEASASAAGVVCEGRLVEGDRIWRTIIDVAKAQHCDLILMAAHGRHGLTALVLGSETSKVLTHCHVPVLVYR